MKHIMSLYNVSFVRIKEGTKTVELRLNDEKRQLLKEKDFIEFTDCLTSEKLLVEIEKICKYPNFEELYQHFNKIEMGYDEDDFPNPKDMEQYYSKAKQKKYGVIAILIKKL